MRSPKVFLALLFVIGVLFVVGLNLGAIHPDDQTFQPPGWVTGLGGVLVIQQPLKVGDLRPAPASCLQRDTLVVPLGSVCTFGIGESPFTLRLVSLQLIRGTSATVILTQEETLPVQKTLMGAGTKTDTNFKVYPSKAHGALSITCLRTEGAPACLLALK
jgi:hypothetical protein